MNLQDLTDRVFAGIKLSVTGQSSDQVMEPLVLAIRGDEYASLPAGQLFELGSEGRDIVAHGIQQIAAKHGMDAYVICSEGYFLDMVGRSAEDAEEFQKTGITDHPERKEGIIMTAGDETGTLLRIWTMERDEEGLVSELREQQLPEGMSFEGRFHDLLKPAVH